MELSSPLTQSELSTYLCLLNSNKATQSDYLQITSAFTKENIIQTPKFHNLLQKYLISSYSAYQTNAKLILSDSPQDYKDFETTVLLQLNCFALLNTIKTEFCCSSENVNEHPHIKDIIALIFESNETNCIKLHGHVLIAVYVYDKVINIQNEETKNKLKKYLSMFLNENGLTLKLNIKVPFVNVNASTITELVHSIPNENENEKKMLSFCIDFFDFIFSSEDSSETDLQPFITKMNSILQLNSIYQLSLTLLICNKLNTNYKTISTKDKLPFFQWLIKSFIQYNISLFNLDESIINDFGNALCNNSGTIFSQDASFILETLPLFFIKLANETPKHKQNENTSFNAFIKEILSKGPAVSELLYYAIYYYKIIIKEINTQCLSNITLTPVSKNTIYFDIYFYLMLMHSQLKQILINKEHFASMIRQFDQHEIIHPMDYLPQTANIDKLIEFKNKNDYSKINSFIGENAVYYDRMKYSVISSRTKKTVLDYFKKLSAKYQAYIVCLELQGDDISTVKEEHITEYRKCDIGEVCYVFKGVFTVDKKKQKDILLYDKRSLRWFSVSQRQWLIKCNFSKCEVVTMFYFRKPETTNKNIYEHNTSVVVSLDALFDDKNKSEIYLTLILLLMTVNVKIFKSQNEMHKLINTNSILIIEKLFNAIQTKSNLKHNTLLKQILFDICHNNISLNQTFLSITTTNSPSHNPHNPTSSLNTQTIPSLHKYLLIDPELMYLKLSSSLTEDFIETDTCNKPFFFWNIKYYITHFNSLNIQNNKFALYLTFTLFHSKLLQNETSKFWTEQFPKKNSILPFTVAKLSKTFETYFNNSKDLNFKSLSLYWSSATLEMVDDFIWKYLSDIMILCSETNDKDVKLHLTEFLNRNKQFMQFQNSNDKHIISYLTILHLFIKTTFAHDKALYSELLEICFNAGDKSIQLTNFQSIILQDYLNQNIKELSNKDEATLINKIKDVALFILDNSALQEWLIQVLNEVMQSKREFIRFYKDKELRKVFIDLFAFSNNIKLKYVIVLFITYCKVNKEIKTIEAIANDIRKKNLSYHYIFLAMQTNMKHEQSVTNTLNNNNNNNSNVSSSSSDDIITQLNAIQTQLNKEWYALYEVTEDIELKSPQLTIERKPFVIYHFHKSKIDFLKQTVRYHYWKYALKGLITLQQNGKSIEKVLIKNKHNAYWYSVTDNKWHKSHNEFTQNKKGNVIAVYTLTPNKPKAASLSFDDICLEDTSNIKPIPLHAPLKHGLVWLVNDAYNVFYEHIQLFHNMFTLNEIFKLQHIALNEPTKTTLKKQLTDKAKAITLSQFDNIF